MLVFRGAAAIPALTLSFKPSSLFVKPLPTWNFLASILIMDKVLGRVLLLMRDFNWDRKSKDSEARYLAAEAIGAFYSLAAAWLLWTGFTCFPCAELPQRPLSLLCSFPLLCSWLLPSHFLLSLFTNPTSVSTHGSWLASVCYPSPKNLSLFMHKMSQF